MIADSIIVEKGTTALIGELGYAGFVRYMRLLSNGHGDYLKIKDDIFSDMTVDEIFDLASEEWSGVKKGRSFEEYA